VIIVDAGGGTVDISAYCASKGAGSKSASFEEMCIPQCKRFGWLRDSETHIL